MRSKILLVLLIVFSVLSFSSEERTLSILVPSSLTLDEVKVSGWTEEGSNSISLGNGVVTDFDTEAITYGNTTKYLKVTVEDVDLTEGAKLIVGYPLSDGAIPSYVVVANSEIKTTKIVVAGVEYTLEELFKTETRDLEDLLDASDFTYENFPGKELNESMRLSGFVVGDQPMDPDTDDPSNIVDVLYKNGDLGNASNEVLGDATINPTGSTQNNEFELWAIKVYPPDHEKAGEPIYQTDDNGLIKRVDEKGDPILKQDNNGNVIVPNEYYYLPLRKLLYSNKGDEDPLYSDFSEFTGNNKPEDGIWYASEENNPTSGGDYLANDGESYPFGYYEHFKFDIQVRFQGGQGSLVINGKQTNFNDAGFKWDFWEADDVTLAYNKNTNGQGGYFTFGLGGKETIIIGEKPGEIEPPVEEKYFVIDDTGEAMKSEASLLSKYQNTERERKTNVIMKVVTTEGESEESFEIKGISE